MPRPKTAEQREARRLRAEGLSLRAIAACVGASQSSVSVWVRDVERVGAPLPPGAMPQAGEVVVLEFDHIGPKTAEVAQLVLRGASIDRIDREIAACEVVCANCRRRRTADRAQWRRRARDWRALPQPARADVARNVTIVLETLECASCADCGEDDLVVLEFDHVGEKRGNVSAMAWRGVSEEALRAEIARCDVRCANCHRRRTAQTGGWYRASR